MPCGFFFNPTLSSHGRHHQVQKEVSKITIILNSILPEILNGEIKKHNCYMVCMHFFLRKRTLTTMLSNIRRDKECLHDENLLKKLLLDTIKCRSEYNEGQTIV